ncbi:M12 family metallopeptidase [Pedobacter sp. UBA5917]|uniref:M12 family metallopeptidase n=1 Tax=Pedobacter sp. UBA5917 TaxID=1947061 RepID=UPI0025DD8F44|nr:M12 family metallopeptidase [Pedobacter sp. UBA5917]
MKFLKLNKTLIATFALATVLYSCKKEKPTETADLQKPEAMSASQISGIKICTERSLEDGTTPRGAVITSTKWPNGSTIKVSLNGGTAAIRAKVIQFAKTWETYANIKFNFVTNDNTAKIRVTFNSGGSWSYIGKSTPSSGATMNYGWFDSSTPDSEYSRVVIHEFGHALGMIHEHQHPLVSIPWDKPAVYAYYAAPPNNWSQADVDNNLFAKYSTTQTNFSAYDKASIMHYAVPNELTIGDFEVGWNTVLSPTDKSFIASVYPF